MNDLYYVLDASAFINGFEPKSQFNFTVSLITDEVKDLKSKILLDQAIEEGKIIIKEPKEEFIKESLREGAQISLYFSVFFQPYVKGIIVCAINLRIRALLLHYKNGCAYFQYFIQLPCGKAVKKLYFKLHISAPSISVLKDMP